MKINKEMALSLWERDYGRDIRIDDYAGRPMDKAAYGDRNSVYGWNIDHIYPESKGGKSVPNNLICCNIQTNDEKADKFPAFKANGQIFNIVRVQNHYEIIKKTAVQEHGSYFDGAYGIRRIEEAFEEESRYQDEPEPTVKVTVLAITFQHTLPKRFAEDLFPDVKIRPVLFGGINAMIIELRGTNLSILQLALNSCVMLNTYLDHYFIPMGLLQKYSIFCLADDQQVAESFEVGQLANFIPGSGEFPLVIDDNIFNHTDAKNTLKGQENLRRDAYGFIDYDVEYQNLAKTIDNIVKEGD